jgi:hypothetical protein
MSDEHLSPMLCSRECHGHSHVDHNELVHAYRDSVISRDRRKDGQLSTARDLLPLLVPDKAIDEERPKWKKRIADEMRQAIRDVK